MAQVLMDTSSQVPMVGASGAIGGVLGAYLINHPNAKVLVLIPFGFFSQLIKIKALYVLGFWFVLQFINSSIMSSQGGGVAYAAHIGGFISGMILILFFNRFMCTSFSNGAWLTVLQNGRVILFVRVNPISFNGAQSITTRSLCTARLFNNFFIYVYAWRCYAFNWKYVVYVDFRGQY